MRMEKMPVEMGSGIDPKSMMLDECDQRVGR